MTREAFIRKYLGNTDYQYTDHDIDSMREDLDKVILFAEKDKMEAKDDFCGLTQDYEIDEDYELSQEPCSVCGDIDGMVNRCCVGYDPLHFKNCGYG